jgi:hypothetical protein
VAKTAFLQARGVPFTSPFITGKEHALARACTSKGTTSLADVPFWRKIDLNV